MSAAWPLTKLAEIIRPSLDPHAVDASRSYANLGIYSFGRGVFSKPPIEGTNTSATTLYRVRGGQFIYSRLFAFEGAYATVPPELDGAYVSNEFPTFDCDPRRVDPAFLRWLFSRPSVWREIASRSTGMGDRRQRIHPEQVVEHAIPLPPLDEQRRIVARIEALAANVEEARGLRAGSADELAAVLQAARRSFFGEKALPDWQPLGAHIAQIENGKSPATEGRVAEPHEWAVLKVGAVSFGDFDDSANKALPRSFEPLPEYEVRPDDFLMCRANTPDLVGACAIVRQTRPRLMLSDKIFRFLFKNDAGLLPHFLDHALKSPALRRQIIAAATGTSPTMKNISKEKVLALRVPAPPIEEQNRIVAELDALQTKIVAVKALQAETAAELDAIMPAILDKAFKGEL